MANSAKERASTSDAGGVVINKRGRKSKLVREKIEHQKFIIDNQEKKHPTLKEAAPVYKITLGTETFYAVQYPNKKRGVLSKVPETNLKRDLPYGAKTKAFDTTKKAADDLDYEKNIDLTISITKTIR